MRTVSWGRASAAVTLPAPQPGQRPTASAFQLQAARQSLGEGLAATDPQHRPLPCLCQA